MTLSTVYDVLTKRSKEFYWTVTRLLGLERLHGVRMGQVLIQPVLFVSYPLYALVAYFVVKAGVSFIHVPCLQIERIGHFALDIDCFLKEKILTGKRHRVILCCVGCRPNKALLQHWSTRLHVVQNKTIVMFLKPLMRFPNVSTKLLDYAMVGWQAWDSRLPFEARRGASPVYEIQQRWASRAPLLKLSADEMSRGEARLRALGVPEEAWFVCVHVREGGYSPTDEWTHSYRNASILDYYDAIKAIVARGGWCIRMGDVTMQPISPIPGVVDYAMSSSKSDEMDIFLCASCRFFLGTSSGLYCVSGIFGRPSAITNITPLSCSYSPFPKDLFIPKLLKAIDGDVISFPDAFAGEGSELRLSPEFTARGFTQVENDCAEIEALVIEMIDRLENVALYDDEDVRLQSRFRSLIEPHHYCWFATSRIGRDFLRKHRALLDHSEPSATIV